VSRRAQRHHQRIVRHRRRIALAVGGAVAVAAVVVGIVVAIAAGGDDDSATPPAGNVARLELGEYFIRGDLEQLAGPVTLSATNVGAIDHNVGIRGGPLTNSIKPGDERQLELGDLAPGTYELYCDITGHVDNGMVATLTVTDAITASSSSSPESSDSSTTGT
jgi:hypothetical protein